MGLLKAKFRGYHLRCLTALLLLSSGCAGMFGPSPRRVSCLNVCGDYKDECILSSHAADQIRWCDQQYFECSRGCPP